MYIESEEKGSIRNVSGHWLRWGKEERIGVGV
jgi:hypothetical protein